FNLEVVESEARVAKSESKGEERLTSAEFVAAIVGGFVIVEVRQVANGMREGDRQFAARIHVSEQDVGGCGPAFLAQVPAFENRRNVLGDVVDREWASVDQENDDRLAGVDNGFDEIVLRAEQVKRIAVAAVIFGPGFAVRALVFTDDKNGDIGLFGSFDRLGDVVGLRLRINQLHIIVEPAVPVLALVGEAATNRVDDLTF